MSPHLDRADYLAGYSAGVGIVATRIHYAQHEPHYQRGLIAGAVAVSVGVDLSGGWL